MAKFELQEMYLTEYNRLIAALQRHFSEVRKYSKIEDVVDYLNSLNLNDAITQIDLNAIAFADTEDATYNYVEGTNTITLIKNDNLTASNIKKGVSIEGITGTLVDGSEIIDYNTIVTKHKGLEELRTMLPTNVDYYYYNNTDNEIKKVNGTAVTNIDTVLNIPTDIVYNSGTNLFELKTDKQTILYKNFRLQIPISGTPTLVDDKWTIPSGYVLDSYDLQKISNAEKDALRDNLQYGSTVMGVTGSKSTIIDTVVAGAGNSNHIIADQKYYRNGQAYIGSLLSLATQELVVNDTASHDNYMSIVPSTEEGVNTYFRIPANTYTHESLYFDVTHLTPDNIKKGVSILGTEGNAEIYPLYDGPTNISIGTTSPIIINGEETDIIETTNTHFVENIIINPPLDCENSVVYGKQVAGVAGTFSRSENASGRYYIQETLDPSTSTVIIKSLEDGTEYSESNDMAFDKWAFINGRLCRGLNSTLIEQESFEGPYTITLSSTLPTTLSTRNKSMSEDITFNVDATVINTQNIAYKILEDGNRLSILGVEGEFSRQDSNPITPDTVLDTYIGYVNGEQVEGSIPNRGAGDYPSKMTEQKLNAGFYSSLKIAPIVFAQHGDTTSYHRWVDEPDLVASVIRKGWSIDGVQGTGQMVHTAASTSEVGNLVSRGQDEDIIRYTGTTGTYINNAYYEIIKDAAEYLAAGAEAPTVDRLYRARDLYQGNIESKDVLNGKIAYGYRGQQITGTMPNYGAFNHNLLASVDYDQNPLTSSEGYYSGIQIKIDKTSIDASKILQGTTMFGVTGTYTPNLSALNITCPDETYTTDGDGYLVHTYTPTAGDGYNTVNVKTLIRAKTDTITANGTYTITDGITKGWNQVTVNVPAPELRTRVITWNEIVNRNTPILPVAGENGWDRIEFEEYDFDAYVEEATRSKLHSPWNVSNSDLNSSDYTIISPITANGFIGLSQVNINIKAQERLITKDEVLAGETLTAPSDVLYNKISFDEAVKDLITPEDTTATSDDIVFGATAVLDGVLTTGTMAPIKLSEDASLYSYTFYTMNATSEPYLRADSTELRQLSAGAASTEQIFLTWWPTAWSNKTTNTNINMYDPMIIPTTSSSTTIAITAIGTKNRIMRSSIEENNYFSQLGTDINIPLEGISITYYDQDYNQNSSINFIKYSQSTKQFQLGGASALSLCTGVTISSLFTNLALESNYIYNKEVFEFVKLFTMTRLTGLAPSISINKTELHPVPAGGWESHKTYTNLPQYVTCEGKVIDTTVMQTITSATPVEGAVQVTQGWAAEASYSYSCSCDGNNKITFSYTYNGRVGSNFIGIVGFTHISKVEW